MNALKVVSMRLRGTSVTELSEAGEDTDGLIESTSKLESKIKALTAVNGKEGISILADDGKYLSTYEILTAIAERWEEITEVGNDSALLELMAGKTRGSVVAALLQQPDVLKDAYASAMEASGSATRELDVYLDSIQGRIDLFTNAVQTMWSNALDSNTVKFFVDLGTQLIKIVDILGLIPSLLIAISTISMIKNKMGPIAFFDGISNTIRTIAEKAKIFAGTIMGVSSTTSTLTAELLEQSVANGALSASQAAAAATANGLTMAQTSLTSAEALQILTTGGMAEADALAMISKLGLGKETTLLTVETARAAMATAGYSTAQIEAAVAMLFGAGAAKTLTSSLALLWKAIWPMLAVAAIIAVIYAIVKGVDALIITTEEYAKELSNLKTELQDLQSELSSLNSELETTKSRLEELEDIGPENLSFAEQEEYEKLKKTNDELEREIYLLEQREKRKNKEIAQTFVDTMESTRNETTSAMGAGSIGADNMRDAQMVRVQSLTSQIDDLKNQQKVEGITDKEFDKIQKKINKLEKQRDSAIKYIDEQIDAFIEYADGVEYFTGDNLEDWQIESNDQLDYIYALQDRFNIVQGNPDAEVHALNRIFNKEEFADTKEEIDGLVEQLEQGADVNEIGKQIGALIGEDIVADLEAVGLGIEDVIAYFTKLGQVDATPKIKLPFTTETYSTLSTQVDKYNEALKTSSELIVDGAQTNEDYYNSLIELGVGKEDLAEVIDTENGYLVTNVDLLHELVDRAKTETLQNTKLAKSQARLRYYKLVKELNKTLDTTKDLTDANEDSIDTMLDQIDAVEQAIYKYQQLEDSLLGTANAFSAFTDAQEIDALNTYGDTYVEMAQTMYDAFYKTGQVGTQANWAAIEALVPDSVYEGLQSDGDKLQAIYDYFNNNILPNLTLDGDSLSIGFEDVEAFVKKGLGSVFTGDTSNFNLVEGMNLEEAARLMGVTEARAYAMFAELDKYTGSNFLAQLDDSAEGQIMNLTSELEELVRQKYALLESGNYDPTALNELNTQIQAIEDNLKQQGKAAYENWQQYTKNDEALSALNAIEDKTQLLTQGQANELGIRFIEGQTIQEALDNILMAKLQLEEPTILTMTLAMDEINSRIAELEAKKATLDITTDTEAIADIEADIKALQENEYKIAMAYDIELDPDKLAEYQKKFGEIEVEQIETKSVTIIADTTEYDNTVMVIANAKMPTKYVSIVGVDETGITDTNGSTSTYGGRQAGVGRVDGTANANGSWGAPRTESALVGELGPEIRVRGNKWETIGDNGAEFADVRKGDIIFNHKQTEELLGNGHIGSRGKAYASGTAYNIGSSLWTPQDNVSSGGGGDNSDDTSALEKIQKAYERKLSDLSNQQTYLQNEIDRLTSLGEGVSKSYYEAQIEREEKKLALYKQERTELLNLMSSTAKGTEEWDELADQLWEVEHSIQGSVQAVIDFRQEIVNLYKTAFDDIGAAYDNKDTLFEDRQNYIDQYNELLNLQGKVGSESSIKQQLAIEQKQMLNNEEQLASLKKTRDDALANGMEEGSTEWIEMESSIRETEAAILDNKIAVEEYKQSIIDLYTETFDKLNEMFGNKNDFLTNQQDYIEGYADYLEKLGIDVPQEIYDKLIEAESDKRANNVENLVAARAHLADLEAQGLNASNEEWVEAQNNAVELEKAIQDNDIAMAEWNNTIREMDFEKFDAFMERLSNYGTEMKNIFDLLSDEDVALENGDWTEEGITSLAMLYQQMELAESKLAEYTNEIDKLNASYAAGEMSEQQYYERLQTLQDAQWAEINAIEDAKDGIVNLNEARIDLVEEGLNKEIEAFSELIELKQKELDAERD